VKREFSKPRIFASKCLGFAACRWNGVAISDPFIESLKERVDFITVCPEVEIGLGVPRDPIKVVSKNGKLRLVQSGSGRDVSGEMKDFTDKFLGSLGEVDGFILKAGSPSCGIGGFFGSGVLARFAHLPVETEERLTNPGIRERFLEKIGGDREDRQDAIK